MKITIALVAFILLPTTFISCGQKGPLTLPSTAQVQFGTTDSENTHG
ncbi:MAG: LPS translocon maturation chaperone LptM [Pontibacterium sp.]